MNTKQQDKVRRDWEKYMEWTRAITIEKIGEGAYSRHYTKSQEELEGLLPVLPVFKTSVNRMFFHAVPFALSQYTPLLHELGYRKEAAYKIVYDIVREQYRQEIERSAITKFMYRTMHKWPKFLVNAMTKQFDVHEKHGWLFEFPRKDFFMGQNCVQCGALLWLQEQGAPEICTIICSTDYISASYLKGLTFIRTKTLADGDEMCDFQYYRAGRNIDMNGVTLK
jgi:hypothetical protein